MTKQQSVFTEEDHRINGETAEATYHTLAEVAKTKGIATALAQATGMLFGVTHFMKAVGQRSYFKQIHKNMLTFMRRPMGGGKAEEEGED